MDSDHAMAMRMQAEENQRGNSSAGSSWSHGGSRQRRRQVNPIFPALKIFNGRSAWTLTYIRSSFLSQTNQRGGNSYYSNNSDMYESMFSEGSGEIRIVNDTFDNDFPAALFE